MLTEPVIEELTRTSQMADLGETPIGSSMFSSSNSMSTQDAISMDNDSLLRTVIENLNDGIIVTDLGNRILHVNSRLAKLVGCEAEDMLGQPAQPFLPRTAAHLAASIAPHATHKGPSALRLEWRRKRASLRSWTERAERAARACLPPHSPPT